MESFECFYEAHRRDILKAIPAAGQAAKTATDMAGAGIEAAKWVKVKIPMFSDLYGDVENTLNASKPTLVKGIMDWLKSGKFIASKIGDDNVFINKNLKDGNAEVLMKADNPSLLNMRSALKKYSKVEWHDPEDLDEYYDAMYSAIETISPIRNKIFDTAFKTPENIINVLMNHTLKQDPFLSPKKVGQIIKTYRQYMGGKKLSAKNISKYGFSDEAPIRDMIRAIRIFNNLADRWERSRFDQEQQMYDLERNLNIDIPKHLHDEYVDEFNSRTHSMLVRIRDLYADDIKEISAEYYRVWNNMRNPRIPDPEPDPDDSDSEEHEELEKQEELERQRFQNPPRMHPVGSGNNEYDPGLYENFEKFYEAHRRDILKAIPAAGQVAKVATNVATAGNAVGWVKVKIPLIVDSVDDMDYSFKKSKPEAVDISEVNTALKSGKYIASKLSDSNTSQVFVGNKLNDDSIEIYTKDNNPIISKFRKGLEYYKNKLDSTLLDWDKDGEWDDETFYNLTRSALKDLNGVRQHLFSLLFPSDEKFINAYKKDLLDNFYGSPKVIEKAISEFNANTDLSNPNDVWSSNIGHIMRIHTGMSHGQTRIKNEVWSAVDSLEEKGIKVPNNFKDEIGSFMAQLLDHSIKKYGLMITDLNAKANQIAKIKEVGRSKKQETQPEPTKPDDSDSEEHEELEKQRFQNPPRLHPVGSGNNPTFDSLYEKIIK